MDTLTSFFKHILLYSIPHVVSSPTMTEMDWIAMADIAAALG